MNNKRKAVLELTGSYNKKVRIQLWQEKSEIVKEESKYDNII